MAVILQRQLSSGVRRRVTSLARRMSAVAAVASHHRANPTPPLALSPGPLALFSRYLTDTGLAKVETQAPVHSQPGAASPPRCTWSMLMGAAPHTDPTAQLVKGSITHHLPTHKPLMMNE
jgi:hypothetical protein